MRPPALKMVLGQSSTQNFKKVNSKDFFGILNITNKDIAGSPSGIKLNKDNFAQKFRPLLDPMAGKKNEPAEIDVTFGTMRFDRDNIPRVHGQFDNANQVSEYNPQVIKEQFVKKESIDVGSSDSVASQRISAENKVNPVETSNQQKPFKISDVKPTQSLSDILKLFKIRTAKDIAKYENKPPLTFFFENSLPLKAKEKAGSKSRLIDVSDDIKLSGHKLSEHELETNIVEASLKSDLKPALEYDPAKDQIPIHDLDPESEEYQRRNDSSQLEFDKTIDQEYDVGELSAPIGALEYLKKIRAQKIEPTVDSLKEQLKKDNPYPLRPIIRLDSKGFNIYTNQVPDWNACRYQDILQHVRQSIIYHNYDILAVNKPYGIASHDEERNREPIDMNNLLTELAAELRVEKVYLAHRLDKTTTGVLLFATSQERARQLNKLFKSDQIKKTYWCITKGIPDPKSGIIDIPVGEYKVAGKTRSCLAPERIEKENQLSQRYRESRRAISEYNVINNTNHVALVEVKPKTGVKHQIRCHLGFGLGKPILGDHKYSSLSKMAPQTLPASLLKAFHIRQQKVRTLPIHLHAKSVVIPGAKANGETLFIKAPVPSYFMDNLKTLGLLSERVKAQAMQ